jgi:diguanylate cyclase (GGDEF)-like protein/PAS domain S-box-containing protein
VNFDTEEQRAKAFDHLFDAVVVTDMDGRITDWNKGSEALYGYSKEEAVGQLVNMLHVPEDSADVTSEVLTAVQADGKWSGEIRMLHKSGHIGWIESVCVPFHAENGEMTGALGINRDISQRIREAERLQHRAHYDHLTNVPNRYLLLDRLKHLIAQSKRNDRSFALLFVDLDKFKQINDTKGHAFGDQVLIKVADILKHKTRKSDTVARFGGDEFILLLEDIHSREEALNMMETLTTELDTECTINDEKLKISSSIGVAIYPDEGSTIEQLISIADKAMYARKFK